MSIEIKDIVALDGEYRWVVVAKTKLGRYDYYYLANTEEEGDFKICFYRDNMMIDEEDPQKIAHLMVKFTKVAKDMYKGDLL